MKVRDLMQARVTAITEDQTVAMARGLMQWAEMRHLPVLRTRDRRVVGVVTERDLLRAYQRDAEAASGLLVREVMTSPAEHIHPNAEIADAAADMSTKKLGCLPVIEVGELVGMLTVSDLLSVVGQYPADHRKQRATANATAVSAIMYPEPIAVHEDDSLLETATRMIQAGVRHACVVDGEGCVTGILSDRDVRRAFGDPALALRGDSIPPSVRDLRVAQVMSRDPRSVDQADTIETALSLLLQRRYGALPVIDDKGRLRGIVSYVDVLRHMGEQLGLVHAAGAD